MKRILMADETLFKNADAFEPGYMPECFIHRETQMEALASCIKPMLKAMRGTNAFIYGNPATGKTTAASMVSSKASGKRLAIVHANCHIMQTPFSVAAEMHRKILGFQPADTGIPISAIYSKVFSRMAADKKNLLLILDEYSSSMEKIIYDVLRNYEAYGSVKANVWCISASNLMHKMDSRTRSIFVPCEIAFPPYSKEQILDILKSRAAEGFYNNVVSEGIIRKISSACSDLRMGIEMLRQAGMNAEARAAISISIEHIPNISSKVEMTHDEENIMNALKSPSSSGDLYSRISPKMNYSKFYRTLKKMEEKGVLKMSVIKKGKGKTRLIERIV